MRTRLAVSLYSTLGPEDVRRRMVVKGQRGLDGVAGTAVILIYICNIEPPYRALACTKQPDIEYTYIYIYIYM